MAMHQPTTHAQLNCTLYIVIVPSFTYQYLALRNPAFLRLQSGRQSLLRGNGIYGAYQR